MEQNKSSEVQAVSADAVETRQDLWWITDDYLAAALHMVARQFIEDEETSYTFLETYEERVAYVLRQHCPIVYSYFFQNSPSKTIPHGTIKIVTDLVKKERPLFLEGVVKCQIPKV